jgi:hypothetical protein
MIERNAVMRKMIATEWHTLSTEQKAVVRSSRARMGIKCDICGSIGYYRENCPNQCVSPPSTPGSLNSTPPSSPGEQIPGLGVLWNNSFENDAAAFDEQLSIISEQQQSSKTSQRPRRERKIGLSNVKVDMNTVRPAATEAMAQLKNSDKGIGSFEFLTTAAEGYSRSYPELALHQVMRRIMRLLERQLAHNSAVLEASFDVTLLHPPSMEDRDKFYTPKLFEIKEFRDYFLARELRKESKLTHRHQASLRPADQLDPIFRGAVTASTDKYLYEVDPKAGASMHSKNTWKVDTAVFFVVLVFTITYYHQGSMRCL